MGRAAGADGRERATITSPVGTPPAGRHLKGDLKFLDSSVAGAHVAAGSTAAFSVEGKQIGYSADATVANLDLQKVGEAFAIKALATDRYASALNGTSPSRDRARTPETMNLTASGTLDRFDRFSADGFRS